MKYESNVSLFDFYCIFTLLEKVKIDQAFFAEMSVLLVSVKIVLDMLQSEGIL